jgi:hypothetical protein
MKTILSLLFSILLQITVAQQLPSHIPSNGLIGFWRMDGDGKDLSSNHNHADTTFMDWSYDIRGNVKGTANMDGDTSRLMVVHNVVGASHNQKTFSAWFTLPNPLKPSNAHNPLFTATDGANLLYCQVYGGYIGYYMNGFMGCMGIQGAAPINSYTLNNNDWHHVVITFDGDSAKSTQYIDGVLEGSISFSETPAFTNWTQLYFGQNVNQHSSNAFSGQLDDIAIWDRILSACEIKQLYTADKFIVDKDQLAPYYTCSGQTTTLVCSIAPTVNWSTGATSQTLVITPTTTTVYSATATWSIGCTTTAIYTLNVTDGPSLTITGATNVCSGHSASLAIAGANGNYTTSLGLTTGTLVFTVSSPTFVTIKGKNAYGCISQQTVNLVQLPSPTLSVNSGTICRGATFSIVPTGAVSYSVTQNKFIIQPAYTANYTVTGMATNGCKANIVSTVAVIQPPNVSIAGPTAVCANETYSLIAKNAIAYEWYGGDTSRVRIFNSTPGNYFFVLSGINDKGCKGVTSLHVKVSACEDLKEGGYASVKVYPTLANGSIQIEGTPIGTTYIVIDSHGQRVERDETSQTIQTIDVASLPSGLYFIRIGNETFKFVKE